MSRDSSDFAYKAKEAGTRIAKVILDHNLNISMREISTHILRCHTLTEFCNTIVTDLVNPDKERLAVALISQTIRYNIIRRGKITLTDGFFEMTSKLYAEKKLSKSFIERVDLHKYWINKMNHQHDYEFTYDALMSLVDTYLFRINGRIVECPQYLFVRVAICIHKDNPSLAYETYRNLSNKSIIYSSEILRFAGTNTNILTNVASINLEKCLRRITESGGTRRCEINYERIGFLTRLIVRDLNELTSEEKKNLEANERVKFEDLNELTKEEKYYEIGISFYGLQNIYFEMEIPILSREACTMTSMILETMYYSATMESNFISRRNTKFVIQKLIDIPLIGRYFQKHVGCYPRFWDSPLGRGKTNLDIYEEASGKILDRHYNWSELKAAVLKYGVSNKILIGSSMLDVSHLIGVIDSHELVRGIIYKSDRGFHVTNKQFREKSMSIKSWSQDTIDEILDHDGSVQSLSYLTDNEKLVYRSASDHEQCLYSDMIECLIDHVSPTTSLRNSSTQPESLLLNDEKASCSILV